MAEVAPRSYLFVPGDRPDRFAKARASGADSVIIDLEDAVAPEAKSAARDVVANALQKDPACLVRINALGTPWFEDDLAMCRRTPPRGVVIPKAEEPTLLSRVADELGAATALLPLIETARGIRDVEKLAAVEGVRRLVFGSLDLQLDLGMDSEEALTPFRLQLVLASRLADLAAPVDGVTTTLDDQHQLALDVERSRRLGFTGKLCIHPRQVSTVNNAFIPDKNQVEWAERVIKAARSAAIGAVALDGMLIDRPVIARAERILALVAAYGKH